MSTVGGPGGATVSFGTVADRAVIELSGEIDVDVLGPLTDAAARAGASGLPVDVDVRGVTFMDSTGLAFFADLLRRLPDPPRVVGAGTSVVELLEIAGMTRLVDLEPSTEPPPSDRPPSG